MNLKSRLDRLKAQAAPPGGPCPHLPPVIVETGNDWRGEPHERDVTRDTRVCWCGRERLHIRIVYSEAGSPNGAAADSQALGYDPPTVRLRWPEEAQEVKDGAST